MDQQYPPDYDFLNKEEQEAIENLRSSTRSSQQQLSGNSPTIKLSNRFSLIQQGTAISVLNVEDQHEKDVLQHFVETSMISFSRTIFLNEKNELIIHLFNFQDCDKLIQLFHQSGIKDIQC